MVRKTKQVEPMETRKEKEVAVVAIPNTIVEEPVVDQTVDDQTANKPKSTRKSKKTQVNPIVYSLNGATTTVTPTQQNKPRRDVVLTLQCTLEEVDQLLDAGDMYWFGTTPDQVWESTRKQATDYTPSLNVVPPTSSNYHAYDPPSIPVVPEMDYVYKLRHLKIHLYTNQASNREIKSSACFWCTCPFTQDTCHILKYGQTNEILGSGVYCSPECAVAGLFNHTKWDDSEKIESYQLMNYCYQLSEITETDGNAKRTSIQPAVSPYYFLDKFLGNMTPEEFREMNRGGKHLLYTLDKPLTRVLPEIHEEKDTSNLLRMAGSSKYRVKRQSEQVQTATQADILRQQFKL